MLHKYFAIKPSCQIQNGGNATFNKLPTRFSISVRANMYVRTLVFWCSRVYKRRVAWSEFCCSHRVVYRLLKLIWKAWGFGVGRVVLSKKRIKKPKNSVYIIHHNEFYALLPTSPHKVCESSRLDHRFLDNSFYLFTEDKINVDLILHIPHTHPL